MGLALPYVALLSTDACRLQGGRRGALASARISTLLGMEVTTIPWWPITRGARSDSPPVPRESPVGYVLGVQIAQTTVVKYMIRHRKNLKIARDQNRLQSL